MSDIPAEIDRVVAAIRSRKPNAMRKASRCAVNLVLHTEVGNVSNAIGILISAVVERHRLRKSTPVNFDRIIFDKSTGGLVSNHRADEIDLIVSAIRPRNEGAIRKASVSAVKLRLQGCVKKPLSEGEEEGIGILVALIFERYYLRKKIPVDMNFEQLQRREQIDFWDREWRSRPPSVMRKKRAVRKESTRKYEFADFVARANPQKLVEYLARDEESNKLVETFGKINSWDRLWREICKGQRQVKSNATVFSEPRQPVTASIRDGEANPLADSLPAPYKAPPLQAKQIAVDSPLRSKTRCG